MKGELRALLVGDPTEPMEALAQILHEQGVEIQRVSDYSQAASVLCGPRSPDLVITYKTFPGGAWTDMLNLAGKTCIPAIVVSHSPDLSLYLQVLESGAADFLPLPFFPLTLLSLSEPQF